MIHALEISSIGFLAISFLIIFYLKKQYQDLGYKLNSNLMLIYAVAILALSGVIIILVGTSQIIFSFAVAFALIISVSNPVTSIAFLLSLLIIRPWELMDGTENYLSVMVKLSAGLSIASWIFKRIKTKDPFILWNTPILILTFLFAWIFFCQCFSLSPLQKIKDTFDTISPVIVICFLICNSTQSRKDIDLFERSILISVCTICFISLINFISNDSFGDPTFRLSGPGMMGNPNDLAALVSIALPIAILGSFKKSKIYSFLKICIILILFISLISTQSRGAILAIGLMGFAWLIFVYKGKLITKSIIGALLLITISVLPLFITREDKELSVSQTSRLNYVTVGFRMLRASPIVGFGINGYEDNYERFTDNFTEFGLRTAHSSWVLMMAEAGLPGLILFISFFISIFIRAIRLSAFFPELVISLVGYGLSMTFLSHTYLLFPYLLCSLILGADSFNRSPKITKLSHSI